ncbi:hypothetical protein [Lacinutrix sp. Hel_I_90]|uniref:hypothetical protein n=1 Tax=Lacinutrix sp. Hel_I_90 TaxID=1249999 RepID=UPI0005CA7715|nr:hypothetical protein [Lacinutrix sp. Hel_I_90]
MMKKELKCILISTVVSLMIVLSSVFGFEKFSNSFELLVVPIITIIYLWKVRPKAINFTFFMVFYTLGDLVWISGIEAKYDFFYYVTNGLFILGYVFLLVEIFKNINFKRVLIAHGLEFFVLIVLLIYMMYVLIKIVKPATFVTDYKLAVQILELIYNSILLLLLTSSVLYYIQDTTKKNLVFFLGCTLLVFSELVLIGYYYMVDDIRLSYVSTSLYIFGFLLLYYQTLMKKETVPFVSS